MPVATTQLIERIARVLAGEHLSANAEGDASSAVRSVEAQWPGFRGQAIAVLRTMREPDDAMAQAGDVDVWRSMIAAALGDGSGSEPDQDDQEHLGVGENAFIEGP